MQSAASQPTPPSATEEDDVVLELISGHFKKKKYTDDAEEKKDHVTNDAREQPESNQPAPHMDEEEDVVLELINGTFSKKKAKFRIDAKEREDTMNERRSEVSGSTEGEKETSTSTSTGTMGTDESTAPDGASQQTLDNNKTPVTENKVGSSASSSMGEVDMEILRASSLRRDQRAPVAPGAVRFYPDGRTPSTDLMLDEEQPAPTEDGTPDTSPAEEAHHVVPEATTVKETPLVHAAVLQQWLDASNDTPTRWYSKRNMIVGGLILLIVIIGVIVTVTVLTTTRSSSNSESAEIQLVTLAPSMVASSSPSMAFETALAELIRSHSPETDLTSNPALAWMLNDTYSMTVLEGNDDRLVQRFVLATV